MIDANKQIIVDLFEKSFPALSLALGPENLERLLDGGAIIELPAGRQFIRQGMAVGYVSFLLSGEMRACLERENGLLEINRIYSGECLGEVSVFSGGEKAAVSVFAATQCRLVRIHQLSLEKLISENDAIARIMLEYFINLMSARYRASMVLIEKQIKTGA